MGLARFEKDFDVVNYCSHEKDRSLTLTLIQLSDSPRKFSSRFAHSPEWAEGLDFWNFTFSSSSSSSSLSTTTTTTTNGSSSKSDLNRRHLDFHSELGLYLPRHEKPNSAPISLKRIEIHSKIPTNHFTPERIRILMRKEKDLLAQNDSMEQRFLFGTSLPPPPVPTNSFRQCTSIDLKSPDEITFPLRHLTSKSPLITDEKPSLNETNPMNSSLNSDALKSLLKEHLTSLLTRGASTMINQPSTTTEMKQQSNRSESKLNEEKSSRFDETNSFNGNILIRSSGNSQSSPLIYYQKSSLGLTVTPLELNSTKQFQSISLEKMAQERNLFLHQDNDSSSVSSVTSTRPVTQPIPQSTTTTTTTIPLNPSSLNSTNSSSHRFLIRKPMESAHYSSNGDLLSLNENSLKTNENLRRIPFHHHQQHRSTGKFPSNRNVAPTTIDLLPPIISGKRLHIPLGNHRYL